ncbi:MAG: phosphoribosylglycinamide formyltransferase [Chitinophagales bacterium]|nr:phosphoribosylglycinamide formyltransferase [Chitinophagales bacterium]
MFKNSTSKEDKVQVALFGSGTGSNAETIIKTFKDHPTILPALVVSNKVDAGILNKAAFHNIPSAVISKEELQDQEKTIKVLADHKINFIVLAGFLLKIPSYLINAFPNKIINIHPALLPDFGGKGMYGMRVHEAVKRSGASKTGITIHYVDEVYDHGKVIFQRQIKLTPSDSPESIAQMVLKEEHEWYPKIIESLLHKG